MTIAHEMFEGKNPYKDELGQFWWMRLSDGDIVYHRMDGPARIDEDGKIRWYLNGTEIFSEKEYWQLVKLVAYW
jgi:hypothetical protein